MTETWLRKQRSMHMGPVDVTVSVPPELADRIRASALYQKVGRPAIQRVRHPGTRTNGNGNHVAAAPAPAPGSQHLDAAGREIAARIADVSWYHTIDLGHGVVTPGLVDHRAQLPYYGLPASLEGKRVLDVATFDGFWAFEFERRGAEVVAADVANWSDVDMPRRMLPYAADFELDGPTGEAFRIAHDILDSKVKRIECSVYDLDPDEIGKFDIVFISDLLLHLRCPQRAIESAASVCKGELVIADVFTPMLEGYGNLPLAQLTAPSHTWWLPNVQTLRMMMHVAGCEPIDEVSRFVLDWAIDDPMHKVVLRGRVPEDPTWLRVSREVAEVTEPKWKTNAELLA
jgi:tRNA (mo5U34)-methyltransferase